MHIYKWREKYERIMSILLSTALESPNRLREARNGGQPVICCYGDNTGNAERAHSKWGKHGIWRNAKLKLMYWESAYTELLKLYAGRLESHPGVTTLNWRYLQETMKQYFFSRIMSDEAPDLFMYFGSSSCFQNGPERLLGKPEMREARGRRSQSFLKIEEGLMKVPCTAYPDCSEKVFCIRRRYLGVERLKVLETYRRLSVAGDTPEIQRNYACCIGRKG